MRKKDRERERRGRRRKRREAEGGWEILGEWQGFAPYFDKIFSITSLSDHHYMICFCMLLFVMPKYASMLLRMLNIKPL